MRAHPLMKCENCMAFEPSEANKQQGTCRARVPQSHALPIPGLIGGEQRHKIMAVFPATFSKDWCMDFQPDQHAPEIKSFEENKQTSSNQALN